MSKRFLDFAQFPAIETDRFILREMTPSDVTTLLKHFGNPEVVRFIAMQPIKTLEQANEWMRWMGGFFAAQDGLRWSIVLKEDNILIGSAGLHNWNQEANYAKIGYDIASPYWDEDYAVEVVRALVDFGLHHMNLNRVEADAVHGNIGAMKALQKLGFKQEGILRQRLFKGGKYYDVYLFGLLRPDYLNQQASSQ